MAASSFSMSGFLPAHHYLLARYLQSEQLSPMDDPTQVEQYVSSAIKWLEVAISASDGALPNASPSQILGPLPNFQLVSRLAFLKSWDLPNYPRNLFLTGGVARHAALSGETKVTFFAEILKHFINKLHSEPDTFENSARRLKELLLICELVSVPDIAYPYVFKDQEPLIHFVQSQILPSRTLVTSSEKERKVEAANVGARITLLGFVLFQWLQRAKIHESQEDKASHTVVQALKRLFTRYKIAQRFESAGTIVRCLSFPAGWKDPVSEKIIGFINTWKTKQADESEVDVILLRRFSFILNESITASLLDIPGRSAPLKLEDCLQRMVKGTQFSINGKFTVKEKIGFCEMSALILCHLGESASYSLDELLAVAPKSKRGNTIFEITKRLLEVFSPYCQQLLSPKGESYSQSTASRLVIQEGEAYLALFKNLAFYIEKNAQPQSRFVIGLLAMSLFKELLLPIAESRPELLEELLSSMAIVVNQTVCIDSSYSASPIEQMNHRNLRTLEHFFFLNALCGLMEFFVNDRRWQGIDSQTMQHVIERLSAIFKQIKEVDNSAMMFKLQKHVPSCLKKYLPAKSAGSDGDYAIVSVNCCKFLVN